MHCNVTFASVEFLVEEHAEEASWFVKEDALKAVRNAHASRILSIARLDSALACCPLHAQLAGTC